MPVIEREGQRSFFETIDVTSPWISEPETILFHHGIGTTSGVWVDWVPILASTYRLVLLDMRGFGQSPAHAAGWSWQSLAADVLAVADAAGLARFHFVGESIGGTLGLYLAVNHGERLQSLTVSNGAHRGAAVQNVDPWREMIERDGQVAWSLQLMRWRFYPDALSKAQYDWFHGVQSTCSVDATLGLAQLLLDADLTGEVRKVRVPTLLLCPDDSPFIPVSISVDLYQRLPDAELQVFAHTRHGLPYSHGAECAGVLKRFLARRFAISASAPVDRPRG